MNTPGSFWCDCNGVGYSDMDVVEENIDGVSYCSDVGQFIIDLSHSNESL